MGGACEFGGQLENTDAEMDATCRGPYLWASSLNLKRGLNVSGYLIPPWGPRCNKVSVNYVLCCIQMICYPVHKPELLMAKPLKINAALVYMNCSHIYHFLRSLHYLYVVVLSSTIFIFVGNSVLFRNTPTTTVQKS